MTKDKKVTVKMDARCAAAVRQVLFEAQKGYTYDEVSVPPRISDIRSVIQDIDADLGGCSWCMKVHAVAPLVVCETTIPGFRKTLIKYYKDHSFDSQTGLITGELNGKVLVHKDPKFAPFFKQVKNKVEEYMKLFSFDIEKCDLNFVKSWYTVCDPKFNVPPHHHSCSHISYVYYLNVENNDPLFFKFDNPNEWFGDSFSFCKERDGVNSLLYKVQPLPETLLIFPGKVTHYTNSSRNSNRMCIAGDIVLTLKEDVLDYESGLLPNTHWKQF